MPEKTSSIEQHQESEQKTSSEEIKEGKRGAEEMEKDLRGQILLGQVGLEHGNHGHFIVQGLNGQKYGELHLEYPGRIVTLVTNIANREQYPESMSVPFAVYGHIFNPGNSVIDNAKSSIYNGGPSFDLNKGEISALINRLCQDISRGKTELMKLEKDKQLSNEVAEIKVKTQFLIEQLESAKDKLQKRLDLLEEFEKKTKTSLVLRE